MKPVVAPTHDNFVRHGTTRDAILLAIVLVACSLLYYADRIVTTFGWTALQWPFFHTVHDVHRLLFLIPMYYAAYLFRVRGAILTILAAVLVFLPRALFISPFPDPVLRAVTFALIAGGGTVILGIALNEYEKRRRIESFVRDERDRLSNILNAMDDGVYIVGPDYRIRFLNPKMIKEFGDGSGFLCHKYLQGMDTPCKAGCCMEDVLAGHIRKWEYRHPQGATYEVIASPFVDADGTICQLAIFRDVTERKQVEAKSREIDRLKSEFLSNVSHDLRSPLTSIKGIVTGLMQPGIEWDGETTNTLLVGVNEEVDRLTSLVTNLLNMSRLEAGAWMPDKRPYFIQEIIEEVVTYYQRTHRDHVFLIEADEELPELSVDFEQIRQVLHNLLQNAVAYAPSGSQVTVGAKHTIKEIEISVADQGTGIDEQDLEHIFDKFYRGKGQGQRQPGGSGLGLAICRSIVEAHGGRIWVKSTRGKGAAFYFTLPVEKPAKHEV